VRDAVIVAGVRTPIGKSHKGTLKDVRPDDLAALVIREAIHRAPGVSPDMIDDIILGCAMPEGEQGLNIARIAAIRAGLPPSVPGFTINRFCSSGLQAIALAAERIMLGHAEVILAGGVESMSRVPMTGFRLSPNPELVRTAPQVYMGMGLTAEEVAARYNVSRERQDAFALESHRRAAAAADSGRFQDEIIPVPVERVRWDGRRALKETVTLAHDEGIRRDTSMEALAQLRPAFKQGGTVTAGNASQTSDGAACVVVMSADKAQELGLSPRAVFRSFAVAGVEPEVMGIGPVAAVPKALRLAGLTLDDMDLIELNEAFAAQAVTVMERLGMNPEKVNVNGGAIALGHPLGCTGARQTVTIMYEAQRRNARYGLVTMCIGGGMGAAGVFEFLPTGGEAATA